MVTAEIIEGDVIDVLKTLPSSKFHLCVTSPPYNVGIDYGDTYKDKRPWEEYYDWCIEWMKEVYRILRPDGRFCPVHYLSCGDKHQREAPLMRLRVEAERIGFHHKGLAVWYDTTIPKRTAWGSYMSPSAPYVNCPFEGILFEYKSQWKRRDRGLSDITKKEFEMATSGIWKLATEKNREHPAPYPESLPSLTIKLLTYPGDWVLDPFVGSGTTCVAAKRNRRNSVGIEISPDYVKMARERLKLSVQRSWDKYDTPSWRGGDKTRQRS